MLWLRTAVTGRPTKAHSLLIDHRRWHLEYWITTNPASGKPLAAAILFQLVNPRGYVRHLALMPFFRRRRAPGPAAPLLVAHGDRSRIRSLAGRNRAADKSFWVRA